MIQWCHVVSSLSSLNQAMPRCLSDIKPWTNADYHQLNPLWRHIDKCKIKIEFYSDMRSILEIISFRFGQYYPVDNKLIYCIFCQYVNIWCLHVYISVLLRIFMRMSTSHIHKCIQIHISYRWIYMCLYLCIFLVYLHIYTFLDMLIC